MAFGTHKRAVLLNCLTAYFVSISMLYQISPFFQMYAQSTCGASTSTVGVIFAALPFASFMAAFPAADWVIRYGARAAMAGGLVVLAGSTLAFGLSASVPAWLFWRTVQGLASAPIYNAISSTLAATFADPDEFAWVNALQEFVANAGFAIGPAFGGLLFDWGGFRAPFVLSALLHLVFVMPSLVALTPSSMETSAPLLMECDVQEHEVSTKPMEAVHWRHICYRRILWLTAAAVLIPGFYGIVDPVMAQHLRNTLGDGITDSTVGFLLSAPSWTSMLSCIAIPSLNRVFSASCLIVSGLITLGLVNLALAVSDPAPFDFGGVLGLEKGSPAQWVLQLALLLIMGAAGGLSWTPIMPDMIDIAANRVADERQEDQPAVAAVSPAVASLFNAAACCGEAAGPTVGGLLIALLGYAGTNLLAGAFLLSFGAALAIEEAWPSIPGGATPMHTPSPRCHMLPQLHLRSPVHPMDEAHGRHGHEARLAVEGRFGQVGRQISIN